jgi:CHAT domain
LYSYLEFTVSVRLGRAGKYGSRITVECRKPDGGETPPSDADHSTGSVERLLPAETAEQRTRVGDILGQCLFPPPALAAFHQVLSELPSDTGIRIRLRYNEPELGRFPWELVRIPIPPRRSPAYLLRDERFSLVRAPASIRPVQSPKERRRLSILVADATRARELSVLTPDFPEKLPYHDGVEVQIISRPTRESIDEFIDAIVDGPEPLDIFHFTGHGQRPRGETAGALVLHRKGDRGEQTYPGDDLAGQLARAGTSLAFINACYSEDQAASRAGLAQSLAEAVPVVLAMRGAVGDDKASDFAAAFYGQLLAGSTVDEAIAHARLELEESGSDWQRAVLYSRASTGRFLEPVRQAIAPLPAVRPAASPSAAPFLPDAVRRWALASGPNGRWQFVPGDVGPELRRVSSETAADITHLRTIGASLVLSADALVVAELNQDRLALAWVDRMLPRLDSWPRTFKLALSGKARLLAVAVDYGDSVTCLLSTDRATYRADVSPEKEPLIIELLGQPSRCAALVSGRPLTVDEAGRLRGWELNLSSRGVAEVSSLDAARSAGHVVYAVAGRDEAGTPLVAWGSSLDALAVLPNTPADEVGVVRQLSRAVRPGQLLLSRGDFLELVKVDDLT